MDRIDAARRERAEVLALCRELNDDEWHTPSAAEGWTVQDVVAHMGAACRALFGRGMVEILRSKQIERTNDDFVDDRRGWTPVQTLAEYERWSGMGLAVFERVLRTPVVRLPVRVGELGRFPVGRLVGAQIFDTHVHLRYDIAPALGRPAPANDENRMAIIADWMMAVLTNQLRGNWPQWRDRAIALTLTGSGGGSWSFAPDGTLYAGRDCAAAAEITGAAEQFPEWGTKRVDWRDRNVSITGDQDYGVRFLDAVNIV